MKAFSYFVLFHFTVLVPSSHSASRTVSHQAFCITFFCSYRSKYRSWPLSAPDCTISHVLRWHFRCIFHLIIHWSFLGTCHCTVPRGFLPRILHCFCSPFCCVPHSAFPTVLWSGYFKPFASTLALCYVGHLPILFDMCFGVPIVTVHVAIYAALCYAVFHLDII